MRSTTSASTTPKPAFTPKWSEKPLQKSWQKTKPTLGWPRQTDSLCPKCVQEAREAIVSGRKDWTTLLHEKVGEVKADIVERDGQVWMVKECPEHGKIEDMMAVDVRFLEWIEKNFPGRDIPAHNDEELHNHGSSTIKHGRGSVLTVDLTNRCNMMCDPLLHGCESGRLRPRTHLARYRRDHGQCHEDQATPADVDPVLGW